MADSTTLRDCTARACRQPEPTRPPSATLAAYPALLPIATNIALLTGANGKTNDDLRPSLLLPGATHDLRARACSTACPDRKPASHPDHCRHARGRGKAQTPEKAEAADRRVHRPSHDTGGAGAEEAPLRYRPSS